MKKLVLAGVSCNTLLIGEMPFLIPSRLRRSERPIKEKLSSVVLLLKEKGWYEYVLMADIVVVLVPSGPKDDFIFVRSSKSDLYRPTCFLSDALLAKGSERWTASLLVHESTHVFQEFYLPDGDLADRRKKEVDASREQMRFLANCDGKWEIASIRKQLKAPHGWWGYRENKMLSKNELRRAEWDVYCDLMFDDLRPHILF